MENNPLALPILAIIKQSPAGCSQYDLICRLEEQGIQFPVNTNSSQLTLFNKNFLVMNALYQLQGNLAEDRLYLFISALSIRLEKYKDEDEDVVSMPTTAPDSNLRNYYLDWNNLRDTTHADVVNLLSNFWGKFLAVDKQAEALNTLGLTATDDWSVIQKTYRRLAARHHPDRGGEQSRFVQIREAYEILLQCRTK